MQISRLSHPISTLLAVSLAGILPLHGQTVTAKQSRTTLTASAAVQPHTATSKGTTQTVSRYLQLPLRFEANVGQTNPSVRFVSHGQGYTLFLTGNEAVLTLAQPVTGLEVAPQPPGRNPAQLPSPESAIVRLRLDGANPNPISRPEELLPTKSNYFFGNDPSKWRTNVPNFGKVLYRDVYPGIDLTYYGHQRQLEHDFIVRPGADPGLIAMSVSGPGSLTTNRQGDLILKLPHGQLRLLKPQIYQTINGRRHTIAGHYTLSAGKKVGFAVSRFNHSLPLVIDPVLSYSTYLGGSGADVGRGIAVDTSGNIYVTGFTDSTNFPLARAEQDHAYGTHAAFITKMNADGSALIYSTYIAGGIDDQAYAIAVDGSGAAYITGQTSSPDFPVTAGSFQPAFAGGNDDAFVTKLAPDGSSLVYSTFLGGAAPTPYRTAYDGGYGIAVGSDGSAYVAGYTFSMDFPVKNALQATSAGGLKGFLAKFTPDGAGLTFSTYLGVSGDVAAYAIALDSAGNAYVTGGVAASDFPVVNGAQKTLRGGEDAFVTALKADGSAFIYSTYLGGSANDEGRAIAVDTNGNAYVSGFTSSTNFPTAKAFQSAPQVLPTAFATRLSADGSTFAYSTYLGGSCQSYGYGIAVNTAGNAYLTGGTCSPDFPVKNPVQAHQAGNYDSFVTEFSQDGTNLLYSTFLGGAGADWGYAIATDSRGNVFVTGSTTYTDFPVANPFQKVFGGGATDAFVTEISETATTPVLSLSSYSMAFTGVEGGAVPPPQTVDISNVGTGSLDWTASATQPWLTLDTSAGTAPSSIHVSADTKGLRAGTYRDTITIASVGAAGSPSIINVTLTVTANPVLSVNAQAIRFSGIVGGTAPVTQQFSISNTGSVGPLNWTAAKTQSWLSLDAASGTAPATVHVSVDTSGLAAGTYNDTITIAATGASASPATVAITLVVSAAGSGTNSYAYVTNSGSNSVSVIDEADNSVVATIPVGRYPYGVAITPDGAFAYVANYYDNTVSVIATATATVVATVPVGANPSGVAVTPDGKLAYVTDYGANRVSVITTADNKVAATILVGDGPLRVAITPDGTAVYIANYPANTISVISTSSNAVTATIPIGNPYDLAISPDGSRLYATRNYVGFNASMSVIDTATNTIKSTLGLQTYPFGIALSADEAFAYITEAGQMDIVETATNSVLMTIPLGPNENGVTLTPDGAFLYVANTGNNSVSVISTADNSLKSTIPVGISPVKVAFTSVRPPTAAVSVDASSLSFTATAGDTRPDAQTINITNSGDGSLVWTASKSQTWLTLDAASGTAPATIHASVNLSGLDPGTYTDTITITADGATGSPVKIPVTLTVNATQPVLSVGSTSLTFSADAGGSNPAAQALAITNSGTGTLNWTAATTQSWLSLSSASGAAPSTPYVSVNTAGLKAGIYNDTITVTSDGATNSPATIPVTLTVKAVQPVLAVGSSSLSFSATTGGSNPVAQSISIANTGDGTLKWTAATTQSWLSLDLTSGTAPSAIHASVNTSGLQAGTYHDTITITSDGATNSPAIVAVTLTVASVPTLPVLSVAPVSLEFSATAGSSNPSAQSVAIANTGGGTLQWTAAKTQSWLSLDVPGGTAPSTLHASVDISGLDPGTYHDTVTISSDGATNSPASVAVTLTVSAPATVPVIAVSPLSLEFTAVAGGSNPATQQLAITNTGAGALDWSAATTQPWLMLDNSSGTAPSTVNVSVDTSGLAVGTYHDSITLEAAGASGSPQTVPVTLTVTATATPDFTIDRPSGGNDSATVTAGGTASYSLETSPLNGFTGDVSLSCSGLPGKSTCSFAPTHAEITSAKSVPFGITIVTTASTTSAAGMVTEIGNSPWQILAGLSLLVTGLWLLVERRKMWRQFFLLALLACGLGLTSCGGGGGSSPTTTTTTPGTPAGTYTVVVTGTSGALSHTMNLSLTVK